MNAQHTRRISTTPMRWLPVDRNDVARPFTATVKVWKTTGINKVLPVRYTITNATPPRYRFDETSGITLRTLFLLSSILGIVGAFFLNATWPLGLLVFGFPGAVMMQFREHRTITVPDEESIAAIVATADRIGRHLDENTMFRAATSVGDVDLFGSPGYPNTDPAVVAADTFVDALNRRDLAAITPVNNLVAQPFQLPDPAHVQAEEPAAFADTAALLTKHDRAQDGALVLRVSESVSTLPVIDQDSLRRAAATIRAVYSRLARLPAHVADSADVTARTPREHADSAITSAMQMFERAATATYEGDTRALRELREYARHWDHRANPLNLDNDSDDSNKPDC